MQVTVLSRLKLLKVHQTVDLFRYHLSWIVYCYKFCSRRCTLKHKYERKVNLTLDEFAKIEKKSGRIPPTLSLVSIVDRLAAGERSDTAISLLVEHGTAPLLFHASKEGVINDEMWTRWAEYHLKSVDDAKDFLDDANSKFPELKNTPIWEIAIAMSIIES